MKRLINTLLSLSVMMSAAAFAKPVVILYKSPSCGCCEKWADIMQDKGYQIEVKPQRDWTQIRRDSGMPQSLHSCHTALIDGYVIEGHVPEADIARLLKAKPSDIAGLSAPGMPLHSPGMAKPDQSYKEFNVMSFDKKGNTHVYQQY